MQLLVDVLFSFFALLFTFFGERGEVSIGLSFLAGVPKKVISLNFIESTDSCFVIAKLHIFYC